MCTKNHMMYASGDMECDRHFFVILYWVFFVILGKLIVNKCTLHWNNLQKILKQNLQMMKRSNLKTNVKNYFLTA